MATSDLPSRPDPRDEPMSPWAAGGLAFAACALGLIGAFQIIAGLSAIIDDDFFVVTANYTFDLDTTAWGWIHLIIGILFLVVCIGLIAGKLWAGMTAIFLAVLSAVANFFFIPYYPFWSLLVIALNVWVIWSLTRPGAIEGEA